MSKALSSKAGFRRLLAAVFLLFLLAEFGSHGLICAGGHSSDGRTVSATENGHEDPCDTLIRCGYDNQNGRQMPKLSHDAAQHNALFDGLFELAAIGWMRETPPDPDDPGGPRTRPKDPPFHPPKIA